MKIKISEAKQIVKQLKESFENDYKDLNFVKNVLGEKYFHLHESLKTVIKENKDNGAAAYNFMKDNLIASKYKQIAEYMDYAKGSVLNEKDTEQDNQQEEYLDKIGKNKKKYITKGDKGYEDGMDDEPNF